MELLLSILCILLGVAALRRPDVFWHLSHFLTVKDGEPTKFYLVAERIIGAVALLLGIVILLFELFA